MWGVKLPLTRRGIYTNIMESKYSFSISGIEYFFSSKVYMQKFKDRLINNREYYVTKMVKLGFMGNCCYYADLRLYRKIETRGFKVVRNGEVLSWQKASEFALQKMTGLK